MIDFIWKGKSVVGWINQYFIIKGIEEKKGKDGKKKAKVIFVDKGFGQQSQTGKCEYKSNELRQKLFCIFSLRRVDWGSRLGGQLLLN